MKDRLLNNLAELIVSGAERRARYFEWTEVAQRQISIGRHAATKELLPTMLTTSISARNTKGLLTDGPFAETRELLGG